MAGGRPSKYKPEYVEQAKALCHMGATVEEMADFFDISIDTIYGWQRKHPEFSEAIKDWKKYADDRVEQSLYRKALGYDKDGKHYPGSDTAAIFWLKNRKSREWRDVKERIDTYRSEDGEINQLELARRIAHLLTADIQQTQH